MGNLMNKLKEDDPPKIQLNAVFLPSPYKRHRKTYNKANITDLSDYIKEIFIGLSLCPGGAASDSQHLHHQSHYSQHSITAVSNYYDTAPRGCDGS